LGVADDVVGEGTLSYGSALKAAKDTVEQSRKVAAAGYQGKAPTVRVAIEEYIVERDQRDSIRAGRKVRSDASRKLRRHLLSDEIFAQLPLTRLTENDIARWLSRVDPTLKRVTRQRLANDAKAAFNRFHRRMRKVLPPDFGEVIRFGLKLEPSGEGGQPVARENQILTDEQVRAIIAAVKTADSDGDLYRLVILLAATGARFSQVVRLQVQDVQIDRSRIMMPCSRKGRERIDRYTPVPVGPDILEELASAIKGRAPVDRLLVRWRYRQVGVGKWVRISRAPWQASSEMLRPWHRACEAAGLKGTVPYALRHSSIVRAIRLGLPIRLVAALHDTSVVMIERHYGRWIADGLEELAARAVIPLIANDPMQTKAA
jgi:integrase